jgi:hypothetical protein
MLPLSVYKKKQTTILKKLEKGGIFADKIDKI